MANRRMIHSKISRSLEVGELPIEAQLLFTWMITHADDDGRMIGDLRYVKITVVPQMDWSTELIGNYLNKIKELGLIYYWQENNHWYVEFPKWGEHQYIAKDRYHPSLLPKYKNSQQLSTNRIQDVDKSDAQSNVSESNLNEVNKSEVNQNTIAVNKTHTYKGLVSPKSFIPSSDGELVAFEAWKRLEPNNSYALTTTYLKALEKGLPTNLFGQFASEIEQDKAVIKSGAVFNKKVDDYFAQKK